MNTASGVKMTKVSQNEIAESMVYLKRQILPLGLNAKRVIAKRYSLKDAKGNSLEEWSDIVARVVAHVSVAETDPAQRDEFFNALTDIMLAREFVPNTPCLVNSGKPNGQLAACFVLDVPDSIAGIMKTATDAAIIHQTGCGTGFTFDKLLEAIDRNEWYALEFRGEPWNEPVFDPVTGRNYVVYRRPDGSTVTFRDKEAFDTADLSDALIEEPLAPGMVYAPDIWNRIVASAHRYAEPGIAFIDEVNRHNHMIKSMGPIMSCNPCGEQFLHFANSCNLGSIDVNKFYDREQRLDWDRLAEVTHWCTRFLDNVIDTCAWPLAEINDVVKRTRPVGLGIMGFADLCLNLKISYGSPASIDLMDEVMGFIRREAWNESLRLGAERGVFSELEPNREAYTNFIYNEIGISREVSLTPRNYEVTTIAPTGTISLVAETSSGVEPNFSWAYVRKDTLGTRTYVHTLAAQALGIDVDQTEQDSIDAAADYVVEHEHELPSYFISAMSISAEQHVHVLAAAQRNVDNSVSKTCNGAVNDTIESVDHLYRLARQLGCKAVSYYRDGSRDNQVLTSMKQETKAESPTVVTTTTIVEPLEEPAAGESEARASARAESENEAAARRLAEAEAAARKQGAIRLERPRELVGATWRIPFDGQNLYVTVNHDGQMIQEVFATGPISGGVGLLASKMLRGGFDAAEVAYSLNKVTGTH